MTQQMTSDNEKNSKMLKGIIIGGIIGGALTLLDSRTRTKVKETAVDLKDSSMGMIAQVKENPGELKDQMISRFKDASTTLKEAISDAQSLYEMVNEEVLGRVGEVKDISTDALSTAKQATGELKDIGSKVADAGSQLKEANSKKQNGGTSNTSADINQNRNM
ncbi:hypothetical protein SAMN05443252_11042 [Bacillus sp. OV322]|uniref:YtxH domain-containing protein n=1 Tax=Bacillus sp. OV322 TaxID=1882764 RepID=UPI0008E8A2D5|nr:YtxH domain-containing protein [Bacillus sp. OV322]SFC96571.1 hypothetical protein SAMN05443252_11042 [Bacillus sp. OV322]